MQIHVNAINHLSDSHEVLLRRIKVPFSTNFQTKWNFAVIIQFKIYFICYSVDSVCLMWCFGGAFPPPMENAFTYTGFLINWVERYEHNKSVNVRDIFSAWFLKKFGSELVLTPFTKVIYMVLVQGDLILYCLFLFWHQWCRQPCCRIL